MNTAKKLRQVPLLFMKKEKIILSFTAALIGIIVAASAFFIYQYTKRVDQGDVKKITINPLPTPKSSIFLTVDEPVDEAVVENRIIKVAGKSIPDARIVVLTKDSEEAGIASLNGSFSMDITLSTDENVIEVIAFSKEGETARVSRIVTYSTEEF